MGSLFSKPKTPSVPQADIAGDISKYVSGYQKSLPDVLAAEQQYRPQFLGLNLGDVSTFLGGTDGQQGLFGLGQMAQQQTQGMVDQARQADFAGMQGAAPAFRQFAQTLSPESQSMVDASQAEAKRATMASYGLTPQEKRAAEQQSREAYGARGMLDSNSSIASEILGRENVLAGKRQEAAGARQNAFNTAQQFYTAPGLASLGSTPLAYQLGQQQLGMGLGAIGSGTPQMINPDAGVNVGMQQRANQTQANIAGTAAQSQRQSGLFSGLGALGGSWF